jgi:hypothetical protein
MEINFFAKLFSYVLFIYSSLSLAALPMTITFNSGTTSFKSNASGTANYSVRLNNITPSNVSIAFNFNPNSSNGLTVTQISTGSSLCSGVNTVCNSKIFSLSANQQCCLEFTLTSDNEGSYSLQPSISSISPVYSYQAISATSVTVGNTSLTATPSIFALSVNCPTAGGSCVYSNAALTGRAREITITNTSTTATTTPLTVTPAGFPTGTSITTDNCTGATLAPLSTCTIIITPGQVATSACTSGIVPTPGTVTVNASSAPSSVVSDVVVLSYGCIYQGGFVYSVDDTTVNTGSIGGKTAAVNDTYPGQGTLSSGIPNWWNGTPTDVSPDGSTYETNPRGANNGSSNTATITAVLGCTPSLSPSYAACLCTNLSVNATGTPNCTSPSTCYTDWYLPAICELGGTSPNVTLCTSGSTNIQDQLYNASPPIATNLVDNALYWSSTEAANNPVSLAWSQAYIPGSVGDQGGNLKNYSIGIRCSRTF